MNNYNSIARLVGVLYIIGTVAGILSVVFTGPIAGSTNVLMEVSANVNQVKLGTLFILIMGISLALVAVIVYPIVKKVNEALALGYVIFRGALETVVYIISAIWLLLVVVSKEYVHTVSSDSSSFQSISHLLSNSGEQIHSFTMIIFSIGALMFYYLLYRSKLIPQWLSGWGFIASIIYLVTGVFALFGTVSAFVLLPLALQEMFMAVWLIIKGFNPSKVNI
ncbi:DUF4386 domain-containing protein [Paenibacillus oenotherae]|uniref:DUF4386 domain-containing protein n=1 Tax=Paenibacillus oenotherae TaxID=1435645 RepID=A0ABS7D972_9BACL|nr:DUF4386 domain-containing protein [Paenibacillus oenotherae]MBW7476308.1 DUF4386 domain-containing protein [Paenibacillus oenotherae]